MDLLNIAIWFTLFTASFGRKHGRKPHGTASTFDVTNFGARGDGSTDDTNAFVAAWSSFCKDGSRDPTLIIPSGKTFVLRPVQFQGPCRSSRPHVQVLGTIIGPSSLSEWTDCGGSGMFWIYFLNVNGLLIDGSGKFDGRGALWWKKYARNDQGCDNPSALHFNSCNGLQLRGTTHINSPKQHIGIHKCNNVDIGHLHISAPESSPNTDGIDISDSNHVLIHDMSIRTGDDCVAINGGSYDVNVTGVNCGPGHGISIGSLGEHGATDTVEQVRVVNCNLTSTTNGLRIKTAPGGNGYAKQILFQHIQLRYVKNPIIIDQHYCNDKRCPGNSDVQVSSVTYRNIQGSSASDVAIDIDCSPSAPCTNLIMDQVYLSGSGVKAHCQNADGTFTSTSPRVKCD